MAPKELDLHLWWNSITDAKINGFHTIAESVLDHAIQTSFLGMLDEFKRKQWYDFVFAFKYPTFVVLETS